MSFEVLDKDLMGRIGALRTRTGIIETPALFPVINPAKQVVALDEIKDIGFNQVITNAYLLKRHYGDLVREVGIHKLLDWDGPIMTDSGAYQLLMYGKVEVSPDEILKYEIDIGTDIGVILDIPTQWGRPRDMVLLEVEETLRRAKSALVKAKMWDPGHRMLMVGPVQGGDKLDLLSYSAEKMSELNFDIYAVGSPTTLLEEYDFSTIMRMIATAKMKLPPGKPVHLFGAGHPLILPFAVAMGIDLFDSASYVLYARDDRVILRDRTVRLSEVKVDRIPCNCPVCRRYSVKELMSMGKAERERLLAIHNLYVLWEELQEIKARIKEGTLWEYIEEKAGGDARARSALMALRRGLRAFLRMIPEASGRVRALHITSIDSLHRPEVIRHVEKILNNYEPPKGCLVVILPGEFLDRPYIRDSVLSWLLDQLLTNNLLSKVNVVINNPVLGPVPYEISEIYPLSQHEYPEPTPNYLRFFSHNLLRRYLEKLLRMGFTDVLIITRRGREESMKRLITELGGFRGVIVTGVASRQELSSLIPWIAKIVSSIQCSPHM
ncbi:tRNA guanosine(15) transglycosylase TgtA [Vulcanisaeta souniana]|uniref:tRNA-guanine(15) transglycosylase n=1 Tax=Vulcanisaeta souniana JCM 11219 TaxID=1293586 RepID=A0A830EFX2_9CREN|nr:tRNA guanosine(15) transglycosylase TgtA [Vulcanisaeta souniana]BDR91174.1 tRNA guanosine(15) transglycosylase TgtA [Vulcanisaeta souniana JCM 11219]GGI81465.1 tRNA guanosine(15) transglycosylase TgtA [Vulcanisaeta souniana JCM 11219]